MIKKNEQSISSRKAAIDQKTIIAERDISYVRGFVILINTIFFLLMDKEGTIPTVAYFVIITVWPYTLYIIIAKPYKKYPIFLASYFTYVSDGLFILLWILGTGGYDSPFYVLWYVSIIAVAFRFPFRIALRTCFLYSLAYSIFLFVIDEFYSHELEISLRCAYIFLIGMLGSFITRETEEQLSQKIEMEKLAQESARSTEALQKSQIELNKKNDDLTTTLKELNKIREDLVKVNSELELRVERRTRQLKESEQNFRFVTESIPQLVWTTDPQGDVDYFNQKWYDYTGQEVDEARSTGWTKALHPDDYQRTVAAWHESITNKSIYNIEYRLKGYDDNYRWFLARGIPMIDGRNEVIKWFGTCTDIHDQKIAIENLENIKEELSFKNNQLVSINKELDNFIYTASHDLKAPISNIEGLISMLSKNEVYQDEAIKRIIDFMIKSTDRFKKTISDLTEVSRVQKESGDNKEEVNLYEVIEEVKETIPDLIDSAEAFLCLEFKEVEMVKFSRKNLRSVFYNLISNSIKYKSPERSPNITISTRNEGDYIVIAIKDNGLGMKEVNKDKIFTLFKRLHTHVEGTGVGLYIVKRIIENEGGRIEVESRENIGTTFNLYIKK